MCNKIFEIGKEAGYNRVPAPPARIIPFIVFSLDNAFYIFDASCDIFKTCGHGVIVFNDKPFDADILRSLNNCCKVIVALAERLGFAVDTVFYMEKSNFVLLFCDAVWQDDS